MSVSAMEMAITTKTVMMTVMMTVITKIGLAQDGTMGFGMATKAIIIIFVAVTMGIMVMDADGVAVVDMAAVAMADMAAVAMADTDNLYAILCSNQKFRAQACL